MPSNRDRNDVTLRLSRFNQPNKMTSALTLSHFQPLLRLALLIWRTQTPPAPRWYDVMHARKLPQALDGFTS